MKKWLCLFLLALGPAAPAIAAGRAEVLVLGVYHMANRGRDVFNIQADDVLAPKRQEEIAQVVAILAKFRPTKIALEADLGDRGITRRYADYLAGTYELGRDETEQLGFRLARQLGHPAIHPVNVAGEFPVQRVIHFAKATGRSQELDNLVAEIGATVKEQNAYLASHSVLEMLLLLNSDEQVAKSSGFYYRQAQFGEGGDWAGADTVAEWYRRNLRIYSNVMQLIGGPDERVLLIYGSGHLGWLQDDFAHNPTIRLRKLAELVE